MVFYRTCKKETVHCFDTIISYNFMWRFLLFGPIAKEHKRNTLKLWLPKKNKSHWWSFYNVYTFSYLLISSHKPVTKKLVHINPNSVERNQWTVGHWQRYTYSSYFHNRCYHATKGEARKLFNGCTIAKIIRNWDIN